METIKKLNFALILIFLGSTAVFSADFSLSAGAGGYAGGLFTRYTLHGAGENYDTHVEINATQEMNQFNYGFFAFFDATYGVLSLSYQNGMNDFKETANIHIEGADDMITNQSGDGWETMFVIGLMGKYPFTLTDILTIFPMLGVECQIALSQKRTQEDGWVYDRDDGLREKDKDGNAYKLEDWNSFLINIGAGIDINLHKNFYLRSEILYAFRLMTSYETKNLDLMKKEAGDPNPTLGGLTSGPTLRISAGYRFF